MDEPALISAAQQGDLDSFNRLVLNYQDAVYNLTYRILGDGDGADDATQTTFISAFRSLQSFKGGSFKAWLLRMATNNCLDELRRQKRHPQTSLEPVREDDDEIFDTPAWLKDNTAGPESTLEMKELEAGIQNCLDGLPDDFKVVVTLVEIEGLDYSEASDIIKKPLGTIKSRLARARYKLRDCLRGYMELLPEEFRLREEESL
ncbi:MAG: sigma-70 family RNA polymerase sigma factor [Anaerolineae bacterium]|nr:sigma-70 family RNA polymerase sigma factor [Anaerolineae bacterium]